MEELIMPLEIILLKMYLFEATKFLNDIFFQSNIFDDLFSCCVFAEITGIFCSNFCVIGNTFDDAVTQLSVAFVTIITVPNF